MIEIVLSGKPMAKERVRVTRAGHAYTPERTLTYEARLAHAAQIAMAGRAPLEGPLRVDVEIRMPVPVSKPKKWREEALAGRVWPTTKPDWDNFGKMLDALNMIVWVDDGQIVKGGVTKIYHEAPAFIARVTTIGEGVFS